MKTFIYTNDMEKAVKEVEKKMDTWETFIDTDVVSLMKSVFLNVEKGIDVKIINLHF